MNQAMTGQHVTAGPSYREGPEQHRDLVPRLPVTGRWQPREDFSRYMLPSSIKPQTASALRSQAPEGPQARVKFAPEPEKSARARETKRRETQARKGARIAQTANARRRRMRDPNSLPARIVAALREAPTWLTSKEIAALVGCKSAGICSSVKRQLPTGEVLARPSNRAGLLEYAIAARVAAGLVADRPAEPEDLGSCTGNILAALRSRQWMDRRAIHAAMPNPAWGLDVISNRMGGLFKSGLVVSRKVPDPKVRGGTRTEYRLTDADTGETA